MGQKINPNIFRLGINKKWKTEFFEKKRYELPLYTFKDLEIKSYVQRFLEKQGIILHDYKQYYSTSTLHLYISYFVLPEFILGKKSKLNKFNLVSKSSGDIKSVTRSPLLNAVSKTQNSQINLFKTQTASDYYDIRKYLSSHSDFFRLLVQTPTSIKHVKNDSRYLKVEGVLINLFKVLSLFTKNRFNITIDFCCLNKNLSFLKKIQTKNLVLLQKFKGTPFLTEGIELLFYTLYVSNSANLLAKFVSIQIKKVKRHKFFLSFLKQALTILMKFSFSKVKGIKIMVKGRLNGVPRAKHKTISIGDVPVQSINEIVDYSQITIHNSNGSYGVKVWIIEKGQLSTKILLKMFLQPRKTKYKKTRKGKLKKFEFKASTIRFGELGLKAQVSGLITARQIESARRAIARKIKRKGKIWICVFPDLPVTAKPTEARMGKGKGAVSHWVARVRGGTTLFEVCGIPTHIAIEALRSGSKKLSIKTKIFD